jgi:CRP/FNR family cyclic AMP-dependent transcriptional regulator
MTLRRMSTACPPGSRHARRGGILDAVRRPRLNRDRKLALIAGVPLFAACSKRDLARIASVADRLDVRKGKVLTRQGRPGREAFIIAEGEATVAMKGRRSVRLGPGEVFGELALLDGGPRVATVTADSDMVLLVVDSRGFSALLDNPSVRRSVMAAMASRLREAERGEPAH